VKPPPFAYAAPTTLEEAVGLLTEHAEAEPRVLAGGQSLIPLMNFRLAKPGYLVDLRNVAGLSGIRREGGVLVIGAMTRMSEVERSPEVAVAAPLLAEAIGLVAHVPIRNSGTVGGSLAHADPAAELPAVALALDAELVATGPGGAGAVQHGPRARRDPDRDPASGLARRARVHRVLPGPRQLRRGGRGRAGGPGR
jgi:aerobic carbon-monoxide dehydrogenase medium subunit